MKTIYVNGRFLTHPMTGVERYAYNVCKTWRKMGINFTIICPKAQLQDCYNISDLNVIYYCKGQSHLWEQCILPFFFIGKKDYVVFSFTGLGSILIRQKVMTIHDLSFLENPRWFSRGYYWWYKVMTPLAARTSRHIITVSNFSKQEILKFYPFIKESYVSVVYGAPDKEKFYLDAQCPVSKEKFALAVSSLDPRKNFDTLLEAFKDVKNCKLYIVGAHNRVFTKGQNTTTADNICFLGRVSDEDLLKLYNQATCFIFPSLYEGFGLPPIEAMQCGCPVLASDIPVLREVCGEAAYYFNPNDSKSIRQAIQHFIDDKNTLRPTLQKKCSEHAKQFSWETTAQKILKLV